MDFKFELELLKASKYNPNFIWRVIVWRLTRILYYRLPLSKPTKDRFRLKIKRLLQGDIILSHENGKFLINSVDQWSKALPTFEPFTRQVIKENYERHRQNPGIFLDIGANIGTFSIMGGRLGYKVYAFEPAPQTLRLLRSNIELNNLKGKVIPLSYALSDVEENKTFYFFETAEGSSSLEGDLARFQRIGIKPKQFSIKTKRLDDWMQEEGVNPDEIRLIKIDVEGHEWHLLKGAKQTLQALHDVDVIMEIWQDHPKRDATVSFMKSLGYAVKQLNKDYWLFQK